MDKAQEELELWQVVFMLLLMRSKCSAGVSAEHCDEDELLRITLQEFTKTVNRLGEIIFAR
jgi:hypothetical protein